MTGAHALGAGPTAEAAAQSRRGVGRMRRRGLDQAEVGERNHGAQCWRGRRLRRCVMRHFLRPALAIALLTQRVRLPAAQRVLVAAPGCAHARAAHEAPARLCTVTLAAIARGTHAKQHAAACAVHAPMIVALVQASPTGDWTPTARQPTLRPIGPHAFGRGERWNPEGPRNDGEIRPGSLTFPVARCSTRTRDKRRSGGLRRSSGLISVRTVRSSLELSGLRPHRPQLCTLVTTPDGALAHSSPNSRAF